MREKSYHKANPNRFRVPGSLRRMFARELLRSSRKDNRQDINGIGHGLWTGCQREAAHRN